MEKIINTIKYTETIKNIFIAATFVLSLPMSVFAQYDSISYGDNFYEGGMKYGNELYDQPINWGNNIYDSISYGDSSYMNYYDLPDIGSNDDSIYSSYEDPFKTGDYDSSVYMNSESPLSTGESDVLSGSLYGGLNYQNYNNSNYPSYYGYNLGYGLGTGIYSGIYSRGYSNYITPTNYSIPSNYSVSSGGYIGGSSTYQIPSTYGYISSSYDVNSGGYNYYGSNYVLPANYYVQPVSNIGSVDSIGLTSEVVPNQVLAYTDTNPNVSSVYLSDVPNTGISDYSKTILFILGLILWSVLIAYLVIKKTQTQISVEVVQTQSKAKQINPATINLLDKNNSDQSDIRKVEQYARMKKVLLSSDALTKIVKLSRLGRINTSEYIRNLSTGDWVAIGEDGLK